MRFKPCYYGHPTRPVPNPGPLYPVPVPVPVPVPAPCRWGVNPYTGDCNPRPAGAATALAFPDAFSFAAAFDGAEGCTGGNIPPCYSGLCGPPYHGGISWQKCCGPGGSCRITASARAIPGGNPAVDPF